MQCVEQELESGKPLLTVDDGSLLHLARLLLNLLQHHRAEKMRLVSLGRTIQHSVRHPNDVIPEWLSLILLVPDVRSLKQRDDQPLRLHEDHLRSANLSLHEARF